MSEPSSSSEAIAQVTDELPCAGCGYLLRGLDPAGHCPECNHSIAASIEAQKLLPTRRAIRALKCGAIAMIVAVAALDLPGQFAYSQYHPRFRATYLNPDGTRYLGMALLLLPAAWWLTRTENAPAGSRWQRRLIIALPLLLVFLAALMYVLLLGFRWRPTNGILLASYLLAPIVVAIEIILLFDILARRARDIPRGPKAWWMRVPQWLFGGLLLIDSLAWSTITCGRILQEYGLYQPPQGRYTPDWFDAIIQPVFTVNLWTRTPLYWLTLLALLCYTIVLFRSTRFTPS